MKKQIFIAAAFIAAINASAQVTTTEALKVKTKSNIKNDKAAQPASTENASLNLTVPVSGKMFATDEVKNTITFRWTPLVPKPQQPVTYRLKVWQLMQGQTGTQAMRSNQPIIVKDVDNITQVAVSGIYSGPCKPPYMCDFVWTVDAITADGKPINEKTTTEASSFSIENLNK